RKTERSAVVAPAVRVVEIGIPVPSGMTGIELLGSSRKLEAARRLARVGQQLPEESDGVAVQRVERGGPVRRVAETLDLPDEEERRRQAEMGHVIGWRRLHGPPRGG